MSYGASNYKFKKNTVYTALDFRRESLVEGIDFGIVSIYSRKSRLWDWVRMPRKSP